MEKILIKMPRISNNDDFVTLECWCVSKGDFVKKGDLLAVKSTCYSCKGCRFHSQDPHGNLQLSGTLVPGESGTLF